MTWIIVRCNRQIAKPHTASTRICRTSRLFEIRKKKPKRYSFTCPNCDRRHTTRDTGRGHRGGGIEGDALWLFGTHYGAHSDALRALNEWSSMNPNIHPRYRPPDRPE